MRLLIALLFIAATAAASVVHYELDLHYEPIAAKDISGHLESRAVISSVEERIAGKLHSLLGDNFESFVVDKMEVHGEAMLSPTAILRAYLSVDGLERQTIIDTIHNDASADKVTLFYLQTIDEIPFASSLWSSDIRSELAVNTCQNGAITLPNGTCICQHGESGKYCDTINCNYGVLSNSRCTCPPGRFSRTCQLRKCVPAVENNVDVSTRSLIYVLSLKDSMALDLNFIIPQTKALVIASLDSVHAYSSFILTTYLQSSSKVYLQNNVFTVPSEFTRYLEGLVISSGDLYQPTFQAISTALSFAPTMKAKSNVFVFSDAPPVASGADPLLAAIQHQTILWNMRIISVFTSRHSVSSYSSIGQLDTLRVLTHGEHIQAAKTDVGNIIANLFAPLLKSETLAAAYDFPCATAVSFTIPTDLETQGYLTVKGKVSITEATTPVYTASDFSLFSFIAPPTTLSFSGGTGNCSFRYFVQSDDSAFFSFEYNSAIDAGEGVDIAEEPEWASLRPIGYAPSQIKTVAYTPIDTTTLLPLNSALLGKYNEACSFQYRFDQWTCQPGTFSAQVTITRPNGQVITRVMPQYCVKPAHPVAPSFQCLHGGTVVTKNDGSKTCQCTSQFSGPNCGTPLCQYGGSPNPFPPAMCLCPTGFEGDHCDILQCTNSSTVSFDTTYHTLAIVMQNSFSQATLNTDLSSGIFALSAYYKNYVLTTFNVIDGQNTILTSNYSSISTWKQALASANVTYRYTAATSQPASLALLTTIQAVKNRNADVFLVVDAPMSVSDNNEINMAKAAAITNGAQINIIIAPPYKELSMCMADIEALKYADIARATGGTIYNMCHSQAVNASTSLYAYTYNVGASMQGMQTISQNEPADCSAVNSLSYYVSDPKLKYIAVVNSNTAGTFTLTAQPAGGTVAELKPSFSVPLLAIYTLPSTAGYVSVNVSSAAGLPAAPCTVKIMESSALTAFVNSAVDPTMDSMNTFPNIDQPVYPVVHISPALQSTPTIVVSIVDTKYIGKSAPRQFPCRYEHLITKKFACAEPNKDFITSIMIKTPEISIQRSMRAFCYVAQHSCFNGGFFYNGYCTCPTGYEGKHCEELKCQNGGTFQSGICTCMPGYNGRFCENVQCTAWDFAAAYDPRNHAFKTVTFAVQTNKQGLVTNMFLNTIMANVTAITDNALHPTEYALVTFDENNVRLVLSESDPARFLAGLAMINQLSSTTPPKAHVGQAIIAAATVTVRPPAILIVFTASVPIIDVHMMAALKPQTGTQVNIIYVPTGTNNPVVPSSGAYLFDVAPYLSNGRILPIQPYSVSTFDGALESMIHENGLVADSKAANCSQGLKLAFDVESRAQTLVIDALGSNAGDSTKIRVLLENSNITIVPSNTLFTDTNVAIYSFDRSAMNITGRWIVYLTTTGVCHLQARVRSPVHVILGFTTDQKSDFVSPIPLTASAKNTSQTSYITAQIADRLATNQNTQLSALDVYSIDPEKGTLAHRFTQQFLPRDPMGCANQFVTEALQFPTDSYVKIDVHGTDENGVFFSRTFVYGQNSIVCANGKNAASGDCVCNAGWSGSLCDTPICQNGGTANQGVCTCANGYAGTFCETRLPFTVSTVAPVTTTAGPVTTPISTTTQPATAQPTTTTLSTTTTTAQSTTTQQTTTTQPNTAQPTTTLPTTTTQTQTTTTQPTQQSTTTQPSTARSTTTTVPNTVTTTVAPTPTTQASTTTQSTTTTAPNVVPTAPLSCDSYSTTYYAAFLVDTSKANLFTTDSMIVTYWSTAVGLGQGAQKTQIAVAGVNKGYLANPTLVQYPSNLSDAFNYIEDNTEFADFNLFNIANGIKSFLASSFATTQTPSPFIVIIATMAPSDLPDLAGQLTAAQQKGYVPIVAALNGAESSFAGLLPAENIQAVTSYDDAATFIAKRMCAYKPTLPK